MEHFGIYGSGFSGDEQCLKENLKQVKPDWDEIKAQNWAIFLERILKTFIEEDSKRDHSSLVDDRPLRTFSSGEQRKALLAYLLKSKPDYLVVENPFDTLDIQSVAELKIKLKEVAQNTSIIQLFKRKEDLLPFIESIGLVENERITDVISTETFLSKTHAESESYLNIPLPLEEFKEVPHSLIKLENVSVQYDGRQILNNISWEVKKGQFWKLTGPNGSGKTTILSMIYGDNPKAYGENVFLFGNKKGSGESVWEIKKKIGYFSPALTELFSRRNSAIEMLVSGLMDSVGLYQKASDKQLALGRNWLKTLNLKHREKQIFTKLPLLEQRLILIARAMIKHPPLLILDEPTTALDDVSALRVTQLINLIAAESDTAVIFVSHRKEKGLEPDFEYELIPGKNGSTGRAVEVG